MITDGGREEGYGVIRRNIFSPHLPKELQENREEEIRLFPLYILSSSFRTKSKILTLPVVSHIANNSAASGEAVKYCSANDFSFVKGLSSVELEEGKEEEEETGRTVVDDGLLLLVGKRGS